MDFLFNVKIKIDHISKNKNPIKFLIGYALFKTHLCILLKFYVHDVTLRFFPSKLSWLLWADNAYYDEELAFYTTYLKPGDIVVDVGANIGLISLYSALLVKENGSILSVEPNPETYYYFTKNIGLNNVKTIKPVHAALGSHESSGFLDENSFDDCQVSISEKGSTKIDIIPLDSLTENLDKIDLLKIDVEGFEKFVLEGATKSLNRTQCIVFESYEEHFSRYGYSCTDVFSLLKSANFLLFRFKEGPVLEPVDEFHISRQCENLLAIKDIEEFFKKNGQKRNQYSLCGRIIPLPKSRLPVRAHPRKPSILNK
jgi:FkbM family methyltransferase